MNKIGTIEDNYEEKEFEWKITEFSSVKIMRVFESPTFSFAATSFYVRLWPKSKDKPGYSFFCLYRTDSTETVKYDISFKNRHGNEEEVAKGVLLNDEDDSGIVYFETSKFDILDTLSILCRLKRGKTNSYEESSSNLPKPMELTRLDTLSENFRSLFLNKESCDVILLVDGIEFHAHKAVLIARSPVFAAMFRHDTSEKQTGTVNIPDCDPSSFPEFLEFLYCGKPNDISFRSAYHLYSTSDKYEIPELKCFCVEYMERSLEEDTWYDVVQLADEYDDENLLNAVQDFFNKNVSTILDTRKWVNLLKNNYRLANRILKGMASKNKIND